MTHSKYVDMQSKINYTLVWLNVNVLVEIGLVSISMFTKNHTRIFFDYIFYLPIEIEKIL